MARRRGGYRAPSNPAAVSGPGALSQRTDGKVPQMPYTGLKYGENQAVNEQQAAAPMSQQGPPVGSNTARSRPARLPSGNDGIFGGTERPAEPMTAGIDWGPGPGSAPGPLLDEDPNLLLRALVQQFPHPDLIRLLHRG